MMTFIDYLTKLAPEGETLLIVRQKPKLKDGQVELHADGAVKAVWPAFYPDHRRRDGVRHQPLGGVGEDRLRGGQGREDRGRANGRHARRIGDGDAGRAVLGLDVRDLHAGRVHRGGVDRGDVPSRGPHGRERASGGARATDGGPVDGPAVDVGRGQH